MHRKSFHGNQGAEHALHASDLTDLHRRDVSCSVFVELGQLGDMRLHQQAFSFCAILLPDHQSVICALALRLMLVNVHKFVFGSAENLMS